MKKHRLLGALLAGAMALTGTPALGQPLIASVSAASRLPAPTGIKAEASATSVKLSWNAVKGADAYKIYRTKDFSGTTTEFEAYKTVRGTSITIKELVPERTYKFKIAALVKSDNGYSVQTMSDVIEATTRMAAPSNITVAVSSNSAMIAWSGSYKAEGYRVYKYSSKKKAYVKYKDVTSSNCLIDGLKEGRTYKFRIAALVKKGSALIPQTQSGVLTVIPKKAEKVDLPEFPAFGKSSAEVLKEMDITNYTVSGISSSIEGTMYICGMDTSSLYYGGLGGSVSGTMLLFDDDDRFFGGAVVGSLTSMDPLGVLQTLTEKNGEGISGSDRSSEIVLWQTKDKTELLMYGSGMVVYFTLSTKYMTSGMKKSLDDLKTQYFKEITASADKKQ